MAWRAAASTCAALLILRWALTTAGDLKVEMMAGGTQITPLNDNVTIFCNVFYSQPLNITSMGITWFRKSLTFDKEVKVFEFFGDHQEAFRPGAIVSPWRLKSGDASLQLPGIQLEEAGEYRCEVVVTPLKAQGTVQLRVVASPASRLFLDQVGVKENEGKYMCESSGFYPEAINIIWKKQTLKFPHPIEISEDVITGPTIKNMDGTFNVTSCLKLNSSQEDPGTVYQCVVWHESLHTPLRNNFTLTAARHSLSETEKTDIFSIHWWPISFIGVGLVLLIVLIPWKKWSAFFSLLNLSLQLHPWGPCSLIFLVVRQRTSGDTSGNERPLHCGALTRLTFWCIGQETLEGCVTNHLQPILLSSAL
ncbi:natural cytotoxicity triggering receptor 3 ligand 1 isoform X2 [Pongo abelii]|uniref:natural cytotoxicity triggering receptor 3 ligand 1 isoform X2 n=2 Tax=Pongo TaxID=9599 RepID=UPI0023E207F4|nr:natural cytotoxicity triggering receptor 3 ligand 1 isoform X3 [Pongo pygmaeus]XP_054379513.1 natural cytotoxicity triggering receptor 3 ligand 1 isoform X2 [Pongo abelii]